MVIDLEKMREQVTAQYRVVAQLAQSLADVHSQLAPFVGSGGHEDALLEMRGERSAEIMELLGDILNGMDAVDGDEDEWMNPVFHEAQRLWPSEVYDPLAEDLDRADELRLDDGQ
jgi:hypothetical protein